LLDEPRLVFVVPPASVGFAACHLKFEISDLKFAERDMGWDFSFPAMNGANWL
jgi:hypothetical protein